MTPVSYSVIVNEKKSIEGEQVEISDQTYGNIGRIARSFVAARRAGLALPDYPGIMPETLDSGYVMQDAAIALSDRKLAGWKVGRINPPLAGTDRLAGPIFADQVIEAHEAAPAMPVIVGGFAAAEAEFLLRIGTAPDPSKTRYTIAEATALIDAVHVGIEIASSPFPGINAHGAAVTVSDFGNNNGLVVGPAIDGWRDIDLNAWPVRLEIDGVEAGAATAAAMLDGPFGAARFLFEALATRGIAAAPGQWISSGAVTGVHQVAIGAEVVATFDAWLSVACSIKAQ